MEQPDAAARGRTVVTGGAGFIGRAVVDALLVRGESVTVVDREPFGDVPGVDSITGDLRDPQVTAAAVTDDVAAIVHLAALTSVLTSVDAPQDTYEQNVGVTANLLELARKHAVPRFVLSSTNAVVGDVGHETITAELPLRPLTPYGATKAACEMLMSGYAGAYRMSTCALRFTNVYGPGMSAKDSFVPRMMRAALAGTGVTIHGDGQQRRDLIHVDDIVAGILAAVDSHFCGTAILGSGQSVSVLELLSAARKATGAAIPVEHVPAKSGEMPAVIVDISDSERDLGFRPGVALTAGLADTWHYFQNLDGR